MGIVAKARVIALYLPQFHPIPENDEWWGQGFTEWTNVAKARPLYRGHYQPHLPADLGFYDLRLPDTRAAQAEMAKEYGIEAFCYYHYWFAGKRLLERPFNEVLASGQPEFPFCLFWANQTWTGIWHAAPNRVLIQQTYPGLEDHTAHFYELLNAFTDHRYLTVEGKPIYIIYRPEDIPDFLRVTDLWRELSIKAGLKGLHIVGASWRDYPPQEYGLDANMNQLMPDRRPWVSWRKPNKKFMRWINDLRQMPTIYLHSRILPDLLQIQIRNAENYPCVIPNWDNTPRCGKGGLVLHGSTPELFRNHLKQVLGLMEGQLPERKIIFIKSWNEWAEGNHLEPDLKFGKGYLRVIRDEILC